MAAFFAILLGVINPTYRLEFFEEGVVIESIFKHKEIYYSEIRSFCFEKKTTVGGGLRITGYHLAVYLKNVDKSVAHIPVHKNKKFVDFVTKIAPSKGVPISKQ